MSGVYGRASVRPSMGVEQILRLPGRSKPRPYNGCGVNENPQRIYDTAAVRAASIERDECDEKLDNVKMQAWRACGTRLTPPCRSRLGGVETKNKLTMS